MNVCILHRIAMYTRAIFVKLEIESNFPSKFFTIKYPPCPAAFAAIRNLNHSYHHRINRNTRKQTFRNFERSLERKMQNVFFYVYKKRRDIKFFTDFKFNSCLPLFSFYFDRKKKKKKKEEEKPGSETLTKAFNSFQHGISEFL